MRISIDAHTLGCRQTGNEVYICNLIHELNRITSDITCDLLCSMPAGFKQAPDRFSCQNVSRNPFVRLGWDLPGAVRRLRPDVLHVQYTGPLWTSVPVV